MVGRFREVLVYVNVCILLCHICTMHHITRATYRALITIPHATYIMCHAKSIMHYVALYHAPCIAHHISYIIYHVTFSMRQSVWTIQSMHHIHTINVPYVICTPCYITFIIYHLSPFVIYVQISMHNVKTNIRQESWTINHATCTMH